MPASDESTVQYSPVADENRVPSETTALLGASSDAETEENPDRPTGLRFAIVFACILFGDFFVGYDSSCVATLTPVLSDEFRAINDVGWYGIASFLASASTILVYGQLYSLYPLKTIFLMSFLLFGTGNAISAFATTSAIFIIGRAITGLGCAGIFSGGSIIVAKTTPLKYRPIYQSISGGVESTAIALGPMVAGSIADALSWRACFYIGVAVALINILAIGFLVPSLPQSKQVHDKAGAKGLDVLGLVLFVPTSVLLILALQWGGVTLPWDSWQTITLLVISGILGVAFAISQYLKGTGAMFPIHLLRQRNVALGAVVQASIAGSAFIFDFYLPIYFQSVLRVSPSKSGLLYLPAAASGALAIVAAGGLTSLIGYYTPVMLAGTILCSIGAGLITTFNVQTPDLEYALYLIIWGFGVGLFFGETSVALQTVLPEEHVATAIVCLSFAQEIGGILALAVSQNVFLGTIVADLKKIIPNLRVEDIMNQGAVSLPKAIPAEYQDMVYSIYEKTIRSVFVIGVVLSCMTIVAIGIDWRSVKNDKAAESENLEDTDDS